MYIGVREGDFKEEPVFSVFNGRYWTVYRPTFSSVVEDLLMNEDVSDYQDYNPILPLVLHRWYDD